MFKKLSNNKMLILLIVSVLSFLSPFASISIKLQTEWGEKLKTHYIYGYEKLIGVFLLISICLIVYLIYRNKKINKIRGNNNLRFKEERKTTFLLLIILVLFLLVIPTFFVRSQV